MVTVRNSALRAVVLLGAVMLGACASKGEEGAVPASTSDPAATAVTSTTVAPTTSLRPTSTTGPVTTTTVAPATTTTTTVVVATTAPAITTVALSGFVSPSGNIACAMSTGYARCDVKTRTWSPPPRPANCQFDWGQGLRVVDQAAGAIVCGSDSVFGMTAVLAYGTRSVIGSFACTSAETGMTCVNTATGHGFSVSRDDYSLF